MFFTYDTHVGRRPVFLQINDDWYHMEHRSVAKRSTEPHPEVHQKLMKDSRVRRAEQQRVKSRTKRDLIIKRPSNILNMLNDERWPQMWYLVSRTFPIDSIELIFTRGHVSSNARVNKMRLVQFNYSLSSAVKLKRESKHIVLSDMQAIVFAENASKTSCVRKPSSDLEPHVFGDTDVNTGKIRSCVSRRSFLGSLILQSISYESNKRDRSIRALKAYRRLCRK